MGLLMLIGIGIIGLIVLVLFIKLVINTIKTTLIIAVILVIVGSVAYFTGFWDGTLGPIDIVGITAMLIK